MKKKVKKRETQEQKIKKLLNAAMKEAYTANISDSTFIGVQFDPEAIDAVSTIARGLTVNAEALGDLARVLKASNVNIESMIKIESKK